MADFVFIQARMGSERLYGKVLLPIYNHWSVLDAMFCRLKSVKGLKYNSVIVVTTNDGSEQPIVDLCDRSGVWFFKGSEKDVLNRFYEAAVAFGVKKGDTITRLTADCPFVCADVVNLVLENLKASGADYASNTWKRTYPRGLDVECFTFDLLQELEHSVDKNDLAFREHVTGSLTNSWKLNSNRAACVTSPLRTNQDHFRLTVDTPEDYRTCYTLYQQIDKLRFDSEYLHDFINNNDQNWVFNQKIIQKGL